MGMPIVCCKAEQLLPMGMPIVCCKAETVAINENVCCKVATNEMPIVCRTVINENVCSNSWVINGMPIVCCKAKQLLPMRMPIVCCKEQLLSMRNVCYQTVRMFVCKAEQLLPMGMPIVCCKAEQLLSMRMFVVKQNSCYQWNADCLFRNSYQWECRLFVKARMPTFVVVKQLLPPNVCCKAEQLYSMRMLVVKQNSCYQWEYCLLVKRTVAINENVCLLKAEQLLSMEMLNALVVEQLLPMEY
ncbi:unnamed protein product [Mytilus edulis]|uniref:Uncharacterized protein n=1 Tax=Mytilus edulis TaxID=6550 RepID=A0A8S3PNI4_MYTED|nr:unnamed protein product [Mytilus edulis]